jgi:hypothetical protein
MASAEDIGQKGEGAMISDTLAEAIETIKRCRVARAE